jgi:integrase
VLFRSLSADLLFPDAFEVWMSHRTIETGGVRTNASYLAPKTDVDYRCCFRALAKFFSRLTLGEIHAGHLMAYQQARAICDRGAAHWQRPAGANRIRKEIALMIRILKGAKLWGADQDLYFQRLRPAENETVRAMTPEEQHRFLHVASSRPEFRFVCQYAIVALQTTAATNELRALRLGDVFIREGLIQIPVAGAKNKYRIRTIPLVTDDVKWALEGLMARARELGSAEAWHYLFPFCAARRRYDPARPMTESGMKKPWDQVRRAAALPTLRIYDLRHTGITRMAEAGVPLPTIMSFAGHLTLRMQQHYTAISMSAKRDWGAQVWGPKKPVVAAAPQGLRVEGQALRG